MLNTSGGKMEQNIYKLISQTSLILRKDLHSPSRKAQKEGFRRQEGLFNEMAELDGTEGGAGVKVLLNDFIARNGG